MNDFNAEIANCVLSDTFSIYRLILGGISDELTNHLLTSHLIHDTKNHCRSLKLIAGKTTNPKTLSMILNAKIKNGILNRFDEVIQTIINNKYCSPDDIRQIYHINNDYHWTIYSHNNAPPEIIEQAIEKNHKNIDILQKLASCPNLNFRLFEKLSRSTEATVRAEIAKNPNCPIPILLTLHTDHSSIVREALTKSTNYDKISPIIKSSLINYIETNE